MASLFELVNELAELAVGRRPRWSRQNSTDGAPTTATDGIAMQGAVVDRLQISLREVPHFKTTRLEQKYSDPTSAVVTVTIGNIVNVVVALDGTPWDEELQAIADAINADSVASEIVTASVGDDQLVLVGDSEEDYTISVTDDETGDRIIIAHEDASTADARIFRLPGGTSTDRPNWAQYDAIENLDYRGTQMEIPAAGYRRCYVQIEDADGSVIVTHGPAISE